LRFLGRKIILGEASNAPRNFFPNANTVSSPPGQL